MPGSTVILPPPHRAGSRLFFELAQCIRRIGQRRRPIARGPGLQPSNQCHRGMLQTTANDLKNRGCAALLLYGSSQWHSLSHSREVLKRHLPVSDKRFTNRPDRKAPHFAPYRCNDPLMINILLWRGTVRVRLIGFERETRCLHFYVVQHDRGENHAGNAHQFFADNQSQEG